MMIEAFGLLTLLQVKHWYVDFVVQRPEEIANKGMYGHWLGIRHSVKHGIGTLLAIWLVLGWEYLLFATAIGLLDTALHYHIDWAKMNYGERNNTNPKFWHHLGLDQMAHQLCYILYAGIMIL